MKYTKNTARLTVKYIDSDTEETIFKVEDRNWMNVGELLSDHYVTEVLRQNVKGDIPVNLLVIVVGEYTLTE
jgi:hypothetical protein